MPLDLQTHLGKLYFTWEDPAIHVIDEDVFFEVLEPYVLEDEITSIPPGVLRQLISTYASRGHAKQLEEMICRLDTSTMDLHQTTTLCKQHRLYDALIYVWNSAIGDYVTPFMELLTLMKVMDEIPMISCYFFSFDGPGQLQSCRALDWQRSAELFAFPVSD